MISADERCFVRPLEFIPERWTTQPELIIDSSVYAPFSTGKSNQTQFFFFKYPN
jgi:cytochrome P450